jgi:hypothetical protein
MVAKGPKYLTTKEAAEFLGVTNGCMRNWRAQKKGPPFVKLHNQCRYEAASLQKWLLEFSTR